MKIFNCWIQGTSAMLMHRFSEEAEGELGKATRRVSVDRGTPRDQAEKCAYRMPDGKLYFPGTGLARLMREAGSNHKQKGSRKSVKYIVPAAVLVLEDTVPLYERPDGNHLETFEVDSRPVVIPSTKGRIMRHRPRLDKWAANFRVRVNEDIMPPSVVHQLLVEGGQQIGLGDFRPSSGGPFGTFNVVEWKVQDE